MNRFAAVCIPVAAFLFVSIFLFLGNRPRTNIPGTSSEVQKKQQQLDAEQQRSEMLERQLTAARVDAVQSEQRARELAASLATNKAPLATRGPIANPLKDPEMRQTMEKQQLQALDRKVKQLANAKLIAKLNLSPEQAEQLRELLRQKQAPAIRLMTALMAGEIDEAYLAEVGGSAQRQIRDAEAQIKTLLGPEAYAYLDYQEKSEAERNQLREMKSQFADAGYPLRAEQTDALLAAMYNERQNFKFQINFHDPASFDFARFPDYFTEENLDRFYAEMQQLNARILARVQSILDPEQFSEFQRALQEHLERGRATVRMTQALFPMKKRP